MTRVQPDPNNDAEGPMTRNEFFEKWRERLLWLGMRGLAFDQDDRPHGTLGAGQYALRLPKKIDQFLSELWADSHSEDKPKPEANGAPVQPAKDLKR